MNASEEMRAHQREESVRIPMDHIRVLVGKVTRVMAEAVMVSLSMGLLLP